MAYQQRPPISLQTLSKLVPGEIDRWLDKHNVALASYMKAIADKAVVQEIDNVAAQDPDTLSLVPKAVLAYVVPAIKPAITAAAKTDLAMIFTTAQVKKAEAFAKANAAAAAKVPEDPKAKAEKEVAEKIQAALLLVPGIVQHQGDTDFFLDNLQKLFNRLLSTDQTKAVHTALAKNNTEPAELAKALIKIAKIENDQSRRDYAQQLAR